jgi:hypothetical protein
MMKVLMLSEKIYGINWKTTHWSSLFLKLMLKRCDNYRG